VPVGEGGVELGLPPTLVGRQPSYLSSPAAPTLALGTNRCPGVVPASGHAVTPLGGIAHARISAACKGG
jgi:hypothetical protein